jgi:hypothetical protein
MVQTTELRRSKKNLVFPVTRPSLFFRADPKVFKTFHKIKIFTSEPRPRNTFGQKSLFIGKCFLNTHSMFTNKVESEATAESLFYVKTRQQ